MYIPRDRKFDLLIPNFAKVPVLICRFDEIELTCLMELSHAIDAHGFDRDVLSSKLGLKTPISLMKLFGEFHHGT